MPRHKRTREWCRKSKANKSRRDTDNDSTGSDYDIGGLQQTHDIDEVINPHQRCGYSDSPFARIYFFYTAGSRNRIEGMEPVCRHTTKHKTI